MEKWVCTICGYEYDPEIGDLILVCSQVQRLKIFPRIGFALTAE